MTIEVTLMHPDAKARRDLLTAKKLCINGEPHGAATSGRLCDWCRDVHRRGIVVVLADPYYPAPPGYRYIPRQPIRRTPMPMEETQSCP